LVGFVFEALVETALVATVEGKLRLFNENTGRWTS